ncbi:hypothetical protein WEU38_16350 [Cyanobacterium aponinum AL20118]|uniref:Oligosaccharide repeat unit polymerase n=1 Tax=Cyanobacterium aponinum AL20115 TaxID=3090662 RepID=A0AAF0ZE26_9CHRO|nr:hypothetical protein [Cyanobacterium aponinum]WPF88362.1 hypothetical protein SAY89_16430 [Cyanobacterium aponinum AL20115]
MIFSYILFILLVCLCAYVIWWSFKEPLRLYQFPFFITIACLIYIVPQIFALIEDPYPVSPNYVDLTILLTILSLFLFFYGYVKKNKDQEIIHKKNNIKDLDQRIFYIGIVYTVIGLFCNLAIGNVDIEQQRMTQWTGILTVYAFFQRLLYFGFAINLYFAIIKRHFLYWFVFGISAFWPIFKMLFYARRTEAVTYITIVLLTLWFIKGVMPQRKLILIGIIVGFFFINAIGAFRAELAQLNIGYSNWQDFFSFNWMDDWLTAFQNVDWWEENIKLFQSSESEDYLSTAHSSETKYAASVIQVTSETGQFDYGTRYWNRIIFGFIPAQFLGKTFKESFYLQVNESFQVRIFDYFSTQTFQTGYILPIMGDLFSQFWFFGFFICYFIGKQFKNLWLSINQKFKISNQILYPLALVFTFSLFLGGLDGFIYNISTFFIFSIPIKYIEFVSNYYQNSILEKNK